MKAYTYKEFTDHELTEGEIPADMMDQVKKYRSLLIENAVAEDEAMLEKYFEVGEEGLTQKTKSARYSYRCTNW
jgi:elongation factor G